MDLIDLALVVHMEDAVWNHLIATAFGGKPETAFSVRRNAFEIEHLGGIAVSRNRQCRCDDGRVFWWRQS